MNPYLRVHPSVKQALAEGQPVVALESTIIAHGMPYPQNVETALRVEAIVRESGATPATIAIMDGKCQVGLSPEQLKQFASAQAVWKVSLAEMAYVLSQRVPGATTVAATMRIASMAGIKIFVTGGIGGVHRGAATSMDISTDLTEMARTSVAVISAGVKSILDIGLTLEYLETKGIPVVTFRQQEFPSFYSRHSGFPSPLRLDTVEEVAALLHTKWELGLEGSVLLANPVPVEQEVPYPIMEAHIQQALQAAAHQQIRGKALTPFLLQYLAGHTQGESLAANIALIEHNAQLGARLANAYRQYAKNH
jgi:pseudouridine-5'-phosphate glycosidase